MEGTVSTRNSGFSSVTTKSAESAGADCVKNRGPGRGRQKTDTSSTIHAPKQDRGGLIRRAMPMHLNKMPTKTLEHRTRGWNAMTLQHRDEKETGGRRRGPRQDKPTSSDPKLTEYKTKGDGGGQDQDLRRERAHHTASEMDAGRGVRPRHHGNINKNTPSQNHQNGHRGNRSTSCARRRNPLALGHPKTRWTHQDPPDHAITMAQGPA